MTQLHKGGADGGAVIQSLGLRGRHHVKQVYWLFINKQTWICISCWWTWCFWSFRRRPVISDLKQRNSRIITESHDHSVMLVLACFTSSHTTPHHRHEKVKVLPNKGNFLNVLLKKITKSFFLLQLVLCCCLSANKVRTFLQLHLERAGSSPPMLISARRSVRWSARSFLAMALKISVVMTTAWWGRCCIIRSTVSCRSALSRWYAGISRILSPSCHLKLLNCSSVSLFSSSRSRILTCALLKITQL